MNENNNEQLNNQPIEQPETLTNIEQPVTPPVTPEPITQIANTVVQPTNQPEPQQKKSKLGLIIIILVIIAAIVVAIVLLPKTNKNSSKDNSDTKEVTDKKEETKEDDNKSNLDKDDVPKDNDKEGEEKNTSNSAAIVFSLNNNEDDAIKVQEVISKLYGDKLSANSIKNYIEEKQRGIIISSSHVSFKTEKSLYTIFNFQNSIDYKKTAILDTNINKGLILTINPNKEISNDLKDNLLLARKYQINNIAVFINTNDANDNDIETVEKNIKEILKDCNFNENKILITKGDANKEDDIKEFVKTIDSSVIITDINKEDFLMPIEDVFTITGRGTIATGRVDRGKINVGDTVEIIGLNKEKITTTVAGIEMFRKELESAQAGDNAGILLKDVERDKIERGQVIIKPNSVETKNKFKATVYILEKEEGGRSEPFKSDYKPQFYFRTTDITGSIKLPDSVEEVKPGDFLEIEIELTSDVAMEIGNNFYIRDGGRTIGAGKVTKLL